MWSKSREESKPSSLFKYVLVCLFKVMFNIISAASTYFVQTGLSQVAGHTYILPVLTNSLHQVGIISKLKKIGIIRDNITLCSKLCAV